MSILSIITIYSDYVTPRMPVSKDAQCLRKWLPAGVDFEIPLLLSAVQVDRKSCNIPLLSLILAFINTAELGADTAKL